MEQIGRTSESEVFTSIFAPESSHGVTISSCRPLLISMPPQRRNMHGPRHGDNAGEDSRLGRTRSLGTLRQDPRGLSALATWIRPAKSPLPSFGFSKNLAFQAGVARLNIRKGLVCRHTRDPRKENLSLESFQAVSIRAVNEAFLSVRFTSSLYAQRIP